MKRIILSASAVIFMLALAACDKEPDIPVMTMTTDIHSYYHNSVLIYLRGTGMATIDWGDCSTVTEGLTSDGNNFSHNYSCTSTRKIRISGKNITYLYCANSQLASLDVSKNIALKELHCFSNQLTGLDVGKNTALTYLYCTGNQLTGLDVSKNTALTYLNCTGNQLTGLDVSKNTALTELWCSYNQLSTIALNALFRSLHSNPVPKRVIIVNNPGTNDCDKNIAINKGWSVFP